MNKRKIKKYFRNLPVVRYIVDMYWETQFVLGFGAVMAVVAAAGYVQSIV